MFLTRQHLLDCHSYATIIYECVLLKKRGIRPLKKSSETQRTNGAKIFALLVGGGLRLNCMLVQNYHRKLNAKLSVVLTVYWLATTYRIYPPFLHPGSLFVSTKVGVY